MIIDWMAVLNGGFLTFFGVFVLFMFSKRGEIMKNSDGTVATISGLFNALSTAYAANNSYFMSRCQWYYNATGRPQIATSLFCETELPT